MNSSISENTVRQKQLRVRVAGRKIIFVDIDSAISYANRNSLPLRLTTNGYPILLAA
jgi:hypothetical protein